MTAKIITASEALSSADLLDKARFRLEFASVDKLQQSPAASTSRPYTYDDAVENMPFADVELFRAAGLLVRSVSDSPFHRPLSKKGDHSVWHFTATEDSKLTFRRFLGQVISPSVHVKPTITIFRLSVFDAAGNAIWSDTFKGQVTKCSCSELSVESSGLVLWSIQASF